MAERNNTTPRYSRAALLAMKSVKASATRPKHLATKFNNEEGLFSPDKWIEYIWRVEGVVDRCDSVKKNSKHEQQSFSSTERAYSPQRRTYSGGSYGKVELPEEDPADKPRSRIRNRSTKSSVDFRPAFQKNASFTAHAWQRPRSPLNKRDWSTRESTSRFGGGSKTHERGGAHAEEETPEWLDAGPVSVNDLMELGGFDDDALACDTAEEHVNETPQQKLSEVKEVVDATTTTATPTDEPSLHDDEFIDCFKLMNLAELDGDSTTEENAAPLGASRLSRFFSSEQPPAKMPGLVGGGHYAGALSRSGSHQPSATDQPIDQATLTPHAQPASNEMMTDSSSVPTFPFGHHQQQQVPTGYAQQSQQPQRASPFTLGNEYNYNQLNAGNGQVITGASSSHQAQHLVQAMNAIQLQLQQYAHLPVFQAFMRRYNTAYVTMLQQSTPMNGISTEQARISFIQGALHQWERYIEQLKLQQQQQIQQQQLQQQAQLMQAQPQLPMFNNGHVYNGNGLLATAYSSAYASQHPQYAQPNGPVMAPEAVANPAAFYGQPARSNAPVASSSMPPAFSYQLNIPTSDFGSLQNQLKQAINRGDIEAQKSIRSQMLEALNGGGQ